MRTSRAGANILGSRYRVRICVHDSIKKSAKSPYVFVHFTLNFTKDLVNSLGNSPSFKGQITVYLQSLEVRVERAHVLRTAKDYSLPPVMEPHTMTLRPIELPWLFWRLKDGVFDAKANDLFLKVWRDPGVQALMHSAGYARIDIDFGNVRARFDPATSNEAALTVANDAILALLDFELSEIKRKAAKREAIAERRAGALSRALFQRRRWGHFTSGYHQICDLEFAYLTDQQCDNLDDYAKSTIQRAAAMRRRAEKAKGGVDWPDDLVVEAVVLMCRRDEDNAEFANQVGWDIVHSAPGHWCNAMWDEDRDLAIRLARTFIGHYDTRQLAAIAQRSAA